jgi:uncharacterized protein YxeA
MQTYQIVLIILVVALLATGLVFLLKKKNGNDTNNTTKKDKDVKKAEDKDMNLKIAINLVNKENYEDNSTQFDRCKFILSLFGDSNSKGIDDMYVNITGKSSPLKLPIHCNTENLGNITETILAMITEMSSISIENNDKEKGYYDLISLFIIIFKKLAGFNKNISISVSSDSNNKIESIEIIENKISLTPDLLINNINNIPDIEPQGKTPEITNIIKKAKEKAKMSVNKSDLDRLKGNNNPKIKIYDLGIILSNIIAKKGTIV